MIRVVLDTNQLVSALLNPEDPDDDKFLHLAIKTNASYIVSRDMHLLKVKEFRGIRVLRPEVFLSAMRKGAV